MKNIFILFLVIVGFSTYQAQSLSVNAEPFVMFDGMFYSGNLSSFTWGQSSFAVEWLTGATTGTNSIKWIQGDEWGNGWTGAGYNIFPAVDMALAWVTDSLKFKMKAEVGTDTVRVQFESGADGKVGYKFKPIDDNTWHYYAFPLSAFQNVDGTTNFNPANVNVFQIMAEGNGVAGRTLYLDDVWTGNPTINITMPPIMVDGDVSDAAYQSLASWDGADNWGSNNDLGELKFFADGTQLYIGLSGKIEENWNKLAIFVDFSGYSGISAGTALPGGGVPGFFQTGGIGGTILNMEADFALAWTTDPGNPFYCDAAHYDASSVVAADGIGSSNKQGNPYTLNASQVTNIFGGQTAFGVQAYKNTFDRTTNTTHGLEVCFDISAFQNITNSDQIRFFVAIVNPNGDYWSNEFLPDYYNSTGGSGGPFASDFGNDPNLNSVAIGANVNLYTELSALPVELNNFSAVSHGDDVELYWETASEKNNHGFEIERSQDNLEFRTIGFVPGYGTTSERKEYTYNDLNLNPDKYFYRLKQVDLDGSKYYSDVIEVEVISPLEFSLAQNYPNPFNPTTNISFTIPSDGFVNFSVFNLLGEKVIDVVNEHMQAGVHTIKFNATDFNSGVYIYKLSFGDLVSTKKMILIK